MAKHKHQENRGEAPERIGIADRKIAGVRPRDAAFGALAIASVGAAAAALFFGSRRRDGEEGPVRAAYADDTQADAMRDNDAQVEAMLAEDASLDDEAAADDAAIAALSPLNGVPTASFAAADADTFTDATGGGARAPDEFRPDRDASVSSDDRAAFAPATMSVPPRSVTMGNGDD